jgi:hypothetical protein
VLTSRKLSRQKRVAAMDDCAKSNSAAALPLAAPRPCGASAGRVHARHRAGFTAAPRSAARGKGATDEGSARLGLWDQGAC